MGITTVENKIEAISAIKFPENLRDFEIFFGMINWLKSFLPSYVQLIDSLQKRKTLFTKNSGATKRFGKKRQAIKTLYYEPSHGKLKTFSEFKQAFTQPTFRIYIDLQRRSYVDFDAFKRHGFAAMVYHFRFDTFGKTNVQPIIYFCKCLNVVEKNY